MSTLEDLDDLEREQKEDKKDDGDKDKKPSQNQNGDAEMKDAEPAEKEEDPIDEEIYSLSTQDILTRKRLLENDSRIMKSEFARLTHEKSTMTEKIKDNLDKIENNRYGPMDAPKKLLAHKLILQIGNYHISLAMLSNCSISTPPPSRKRRGLTSILMLQESGNLPLSRLQHARPSSYPSSALSTPNS